MSDLETRIGAALAAGVASPPPSVGLADGARRRLRRRRRTRAVVGGALAVLLVGVPVGLLTHDSSSPTDEVVVDGAVVDGWRTVTYDGVSVDVPDAWQRLDMSSCEWEFVQLGPATADPCEQSEGVSFYGSATFDPATGPGLQGRSGYVGAGDRVAYVTADPDVAWRVLASTREEGTTIPNLSYGSAVVTQGGLTVTVPVDQAGWSIRFADRPAARHPEVLPALDGEGWVGRAGRAGEAVLVEAPTQALAELITGSVTRAGAGPRTPYLSRTETWGDLAVDVPAEWATGDPCGNTGAPVLARADAWGCPGLHGYGLRFAPYPPAATLAITDEMQRAEGPSWPAGSWWANVQVPGSDTVASLVTADRETGQRILDSARRGPPMNDWRTEAWNGLSVEVPASWELGHRSAWCTRGAATRGTVERPGQEDKQPGCPRPQFGLGVTFGPAAAFDPVYESGHVWQYERGDVEMYVDGSWLGFWYDEDRVVQVNAGDRATVQRILDSLQVS